MTQARRPLSLKLDGGGLLFGRLEPDNQKLDQAKMAAEGIATAYDIIGYDAVGVSLLDLAGGLDFLQAIDKKTQFTWLSANLVSSSTNKPIFRPFLSKDFPGFRVAIIGLTGEQARDSGCLDDKTVVRPWQEVLPPLLTELADQYDFVILLTDYDPDICAAIGRQYPRLNLIIQAGSESHNQPPREITSTTLMVSTGRQGKYVGALDITWNPAGEWSNGENLFVSLHQKQEELEKTDGLILSYQDRPEMVSRIGNLERKKEVLLYEIADLEKNTGDSHDSFYANMFYPMAATVADDTKVAAIVSKLRARISDAAKRAMAQVDGDAQPVRPNGFVGRQSCVTCHTAKGEKWQQTDHAKAYDTLTSKNQQFNFNCVPCHVTGSEAENGRQALMFDDLLGVGCEACHGPGQSHAASKGADSFAPVTRNTCRRCHVPEHDNGFDFSADLDRLRCGQP